MMYYFRILAAFLLVLQNERVSQASASSLQQPPGRRFEADAPARVNLADFSGVAIESNFEKAQDQGRTRPFLKPLMATLGKMLGDEGRVPKTLTAVLKRRFPHQRPGPGRDTPFTQALEVMPDGNLVESSGNFPANQASYLRIVDPTTGDLKRMITDGLQGTFVEGLVELPSNGHWFVSTFNSKKLLEYDSDFKLVATHNYPYTGWGLTRNHDGTRLIATSGGTPVYIIDPKGPDGLVAEKTLQATCLGKVVHDLNELEMVDNFEGKPTLFGNVYQTRLVMGLNPETLECTHLFELKGDDFEPVQSDEGMGYHVANGIAYNKNTGSFFVTGKNWNEMFEVKLEDRDHANDSALISLRSYLSPSSFLQPRLGST